MSPHTHLWVGIGTEELRESFSGERMDGAMQGHFTNTRLLDLCSGPQTHQPPEMLSGSPKLADPRKCSLAPPRYSPDP